MNDNRILLVSILGAIIIAAAIVSGVYFVNNKPSSFLGSAQGQQAVDSFNKNNLDTAISLSSDAASNDPSAKLLLATSYVQKGSLTFDEKTYATKALDLTNQVISSEPQNAEAYRIKGYAYEIMQDYPDALAAYNQSISLNPTGAEAYNNRGHAYELQGDFVHAEADYKKANSLDSTFDQAKLNLGRLYMKENKLTDAKPYFIALLKSTSDNVVINAEVDANLGLIALASKDTVDAKSYLDAALALNPKSPTIIVQSARADIVAEVAATSTLPITFIQSTLGKISSALTIDPNLTLGYETLGNFFVILSNSDNAKQAFSQALAVVDNDITLDATAKATMKAQITSELKAVK